MSRKGWSLAAQDEQCQCLVRSLKPFNLTYQHLVDTLFQDCGSLFCPVWVINRDNRNSEPLETALKKNCLGLVYQHPNCISPGRGNPEDPGSTISQNRHTPVVNGFRRLTEIYLPVCWSYAQVSKITICSGSASGEAQVQTPTMEGPNAGLRRKLSCKTLAL